MVHKVALARLPWLPPAPLVAACVIIFAIGVLWAQLAWGDYPNKLALIICGFIIVPLAVIVKYILEKHAAPGRVADKTFLLCVCAVCGVVMIAVGVVSGWLYAAILLVVVPAGFLVRWLYRAHRARQQRAAAHAVRGRAASVPEVVVKMPAPVPHNPQPGRARPAK